MQTDSSHVPWHHPAFWQEANLTFEHLLQLHTVALVECRDIAFRLKEKLASTFPPMDWLCRQTCPDCTDVCCQRAWVWVDFKDLLFLHLAGIAVPEQQLLSRQGERCRYFGAGGCRLDRIQRPFVCTWYLCPSQTRLLVAQPDEKQRLSDTLRGIKALRLQMEDLFVQTIA
jgi:hypothetical protein